MFLSYIFIFNIEKKKRNYILPTIFFFFYSYCSIAEFIAQLPRHLVLREKKFIWRIWCLSYPLHIKINMHNYLRTISENIWDFRQALTKSIAKKVIMMPKIIISSVSFHPIRGIDFIDANEMRSYSEDACGLVRADKRKTKFSNRWK